MSSSSSDAESNSANRSILDEFKNITGNSLDNQDYL